MGAAELVGRERELALLGERLTAATLGGGALVLVEGDAGEGKTALAHALSRLARELGVPAVWGTCVEGGAPYGPWTRILAQLGRPSAALGDPPADQQGHRSALFTDVAATLRAAAADLGLLVVVDDLHWADTASVRLLHRIASEVVDEPLLLVGLHRCPDTPELADALQEILRERASSHVLLGGLSRGEVGRLAARVLGHPLDDDRLDAVHARSAGNPLFVLELLRLTGSGSTQGPLPRGIREVIGRRLDRLGRKAAAGLALASVLGQEFPLRVLGAVLDLSSGQVLDMLDEAVLAGVVQVDGATARFDHALTHEVTYGRLTEPDRRTRHAQIAAVLQASDVDALAHHLRRAGMAAEGFDATCRAARLAERRLAYEDAAHQYGEAIALLPALPDGGSRRADLLLERARCEIRAGAVEDAWRSCLAAADAGRGQGNAGAVADAATVLRGITNSPVTPQIHALCREALILLDGIDPVREARVQAQLVITADMLTGGTEPGLGTRALATAEATGDTDAILLALQARHTELVGCEHVEERLALGARAVRLGRETGLDECAAWGHAWRIDAFYQLGRRIPLDVELAAFAGVVETLREPLWRWRLTMIRASLAVLEGCFDDGRALTEEALTIGRRGGHDGAEYLHLVFAEHIAEQTGEGRDKTEAAVRRLADQGPFFLRAWHALVLARMGRLDEAASVARAVGPHMGQLPRRVVEWLVATAGHAELCCLLGDRGGGAAV